MNRPSRGCPVFFLEWTYSTSALSPLSHFPTSLIHELKRLASSTRNPPLSLCSSWNVLFTGSICHSPPSPPPSFKFWLLLHEVFSDFQAGHEFLWISTASSLSCYVLILSNCELEGIVGRVITSVSDGIKCISVMTAIASVLVEGMPLCFLICKVRVSIPISKGSQED